MVGFSCTWRQFTIFVVLEKGISLKRVLTSFKSYNYSGPVYRFDKWVGDFDISTSAVSKARARSNILFKIKKELDLDKTAKLDIDESALTEIIPKVPNEDKKAENSIDVEIKKPIQPTLFDDLEV